MTETEDRLVDHIVLRTDYDVALARRAVWDVMETLGARAIRRTRFVTAVSEIARNAIVHGGTGELSVYVHDANRRVTVTCRDDGPGIADVETAMQDGFTTSDGLGHGLGGARRLSDDFRIETSADEGTFVQMAARA